MLMGCVIVFTMFFWTGNVVSNLKLSYASAAYAKSVVEGSIILSNTTSRSVRNELANTTEYICTSLLQRVLEGCQEEEVRHLAQNCGKIKEHFECGFTLLHVAAANGFFVNGSFVNFNTSCSLDLIKIFIEFGGNLNSKLDFVCNASAPLHLAARFGNKIIASLLVNNGANIEQKDRHDRSPLFISSEFGTIEVLAFLISKGADVNAYEKHKHWYPLHESAKNGHVKAIEMLLEAGANIEQNSFWYLRRPIHQATLYNQPEALEFLIEKGADVNASDLWGRSSLLFAAECGRLRLTKILVEANADIESKMREGRTPLSFAAMKGYYDVFRFLLEKGANYYVKTHDERTILHYAAEGGNIDIVKIAIKLLPEGIHMRDEIGRTPLYYSAVCGCVDNFRELIKNGANPLVISYNNETILHPVTEKGNLSMAEVALEYPIDIDTRDINGQTALYRAAKHGTQEVFFFLLSKGANPDLATNFNETLLHLAAKGGKEPILKAVLNISRASINFRDSEGRTPMYVAAVNGRITVYELLFDFGADPNIADNNGDTLLHWAAHHGSEETVTQILNKTINIEIRDDKGRTPTYVAAERGKKSAFFLFISKNANMNISINDGNKLIHGASYGGNIEIIDFILTKLNNINSKGNSGRTPLYIAAERANEILFDYLYKKGSDSKIKTFDNRTILHAAAVGGNINIVKKILNIPGILNSRDDYGKTPIFYAAERRKLKVLELLLSHGADTSPTPKGWTLLHSSCKNRDLNVVIIAFNVTKKVDAQDYQGKTALYVCAENFQTRSFNFLLEYMHADPDIPLKDGTTILHMSSRYGDDKTAKEILKKSVKSLNIQDTGGRSSLHYAVYYNRIELVNVLLNYSARVDLETVYGYTPLMIAAAMGSREMMHAFHSIDYNGEAMLGMALSWNNRNVIQYLLENKVKAKDKTKIHFAAARGDNNELQNFLRGSKPKSIRFTDIMSEITKEYQRYTIAMEEEEVYIVNPLKFNLSPLDMAVFFNGSLETVQILLNMTNGSYVESKNKKRWSPLDMAAYSGKREVVEFFLKERFHKKFFGEDSWSAMHKAAWGGRSSVIKLLHENEFGDIDGGDALGRTPLHAAALRGFNRTVEQILLLSNASLNKRDRYHFTPLHLAEIYGHQKFFEQLAKMTITLDPKIRYKIQDPGHVAGSRNHTRTVELLLEKGADPNVADRVFGWSPLHWAAAVGDLQVARLLVDAGASVNLPSKLHQTPLFLARFWGRKELYMYFIKNNGVW